MAFARINSLAVTGRAYIKLPGFLIINSKDSPPSQAGEELPGTIITAVAGGAEAVSPCCYKAIYIIVLLLAAASG